MIADLVEAFDHAGRADGIADTGAGEAVGLREGAEAQHARILDIERRQGALWRELAIGLVQAQQAVFRQAPDQILDRRRVPPRPHRVVRIGEIEQPGAFALRQRQQRLGILAIVHIGCRRQAPAGSRDLVVEGGIGALRGRHRRAGRDEHPRHGAEQPVDPLADRDVGGRDAELRRQRLLQIVVFGIAVFPILGRRRAHRVDGLGRRAEQAFIGAQPGPEQPAALALLRFRPDERHRRRQALDDGGEGDRLHARP